MDGLEVRRYRLPLGNGGVPVLVASDGGRPKTVLMSYQGFLEMCGALLVAVEALRAAGLDPDELSATRMVQIGSAMNDGQGVDGT